MRQLAKDATLRKNMGAQSQLIAQSFTLRAGVTQLWNNIDAVMGHRA
jgi:hypothetical protein